MFTLWYDFEEDSWNVNTGEDESVPDFTGTKEECLDYIGSAEYTY